MPSGAMLPKTLDGPEGAATGVDVEEMMPPDIPPQHIPDADFSPARARLRVPRRPAVGGASASRSYLPGRHHRAWHARPPQRHAPAS